MRKFILIFILLIPFAGFTQDKTGIAGQKAVRHISVGAEFHQDFWLNDPEGIKVRGFNQGAGVFAMYSIPLGESNFSFAIGAGFGWHNLYSNGTIEDITADTIKFIKIPDSVSYKKSKLGLTYLDFPIEFRLKTNNKIRASVGVKLGYLLDAKTKYKGDLENGTQVILKSRDVAQVDKFRFGPTVRFGYDWFQLSAFYSVTHIFEKDRGPDVYPISLGITFMPF